MKNVELCEPDVGVTSALVRPLQREQRSEGGRGIAVCLTLYNEPANLLQSSLETLIASLDQLGDQSSEFSHAVVCVIADGETHLSNSARTYLDTLGLTPQGQSLRGFKGTIDARKILPSQSLGTFVRSSSSRMEISLRLVSKTDNAGKLDSHWWFYQEICPQIQPDFCFQIDAGTVLEPNAIAEMCATFDADPNTAGIASNVMIAPPEDGNLLERFQSGDFAVQKTIRWPSEVFSGFLSVIPGQFSGLRWEAFAKPKALGEPSPKDRYLRGQHCDTATERMMYLSEDRIMGFELTTETGTINRLNFAPKADCHTDTCNTLSELLQQRRRWLNGSLFCRSWMIRKIFEIFADGSQSATHRARFAPALLNLSIQHLLEWFLPLLNILLLAVTWNSLVSLAWPYTAGVIFTVIASIWLLPTGLALTGTVKRLSSRQVEILLQIVKMTFVAIIAINLTSLAQKSETTAYLYYLSMPFALTAGAFLGALISNRALLKHLRASIFTFISLAPSMWLMLSSYAFFNLHDGSWGTKGLHQRDSVVSAKERSIAEQFKRLRLGIVSAWLISNSVLAAMLLHSDNMGIALIAAASLQIAMIATGLLGVISIKLKQTNDVLPRPWNLLKTLQRRLIRGPVSQPQNAYRRARRT